MGVAVHIDPAGAGHADRAGIGARRLAGIGWATMNEFIISAILAGTLAALLFMALHRLNSTITARTIAGIVPRAPETAAGHLWAFSDAARGLGLLWRPGGILARP